MDSISRLKLLSSQMSFEPDTEHRPESAHPACFTSKEQDAAFVHPAQLPNGKQILLLKTLLTSACERDCYYCPFRAGRDFRRATFGPEEFANLFIKLNQSGAAEGIFLSSGVAGGGLRTQDKLLDTADILFGLLPHPRHPARKQDRGQSLARAPAVSSLVPPARLWL